MRPVVLFGLLILQAGARAQPVPVESDCSGPPALHPPSQAPRLLCYVDWTRPRLNYGFRFYAGYSVAIPIPYTAARRPVVRVFTQITPMNEHGAAVCLDQSIAPTPGASGSDLSVSGGFFLGEGRYRVDLTIADQTDSVYQRSVTMIAALKRGEREVKLRLGPGAIQPIQKISWTPRPPNASGVHRRLTVFLHAASLFGPRTSLEVSDEARLMSVLSTVLSDSAFEEIRLIAFNLDQRKEIFRQDPLDADGFRRLSDVLLALDLNVAPVSAFGLGAHDTALLDSLVRAELSAEHPADAILFLGPDAYEDARWHTLPCRADHSGPRLVYFQQRVDRDGATEILPVRPPIGTSPANASKIKKP